MKKAHGKSASKRTGTRAQSVALAIQTTFAHEGSSTIMRKVEVLQSELTTLDGDTNELNARLAAVRQRRGDAQAELNGLQAVLAKR